MRGQPQRHYSLDDYFAIETDSPIKHEYYRGEVFAMAGASVAHNHITANLLALLRNGLRGGACNAFGSDLRVCTPSGLYTYPDVVVICGPVALVEERPDTAVNPTVLVEVLSDATCDYDRGEKFTLYKTIPTFKEYVLIEQSQVLVEHHQRGQRGAWRSRTHKRLDAGLRLSSVHLELALNEIYREVFKSL
jgi:Uma2 family endonuclease